MPGSATVNTWLPRVCRAREITNGVIDENCSGHNKSQYSFSFDKLSAASIGGGNNVLCVHKVDMTYLLSHPRVSEVLPVLLAQAEVWQRDGVHLQTSFIVTIQGCRPPPRCRWSWGMRGWRRVATARCPCPGSPPRTASPPRRCRGCRAHRCPSAGARYCNNNKIFLVWTNIFVDNINVCYWFSWWQLYKSLPHTFIATVGTLSDNYNNYTQSAGQGK